MAASSIRTGIMDADVSHPTTTNISNQLGSSVISVPPTRKIVQLDPSTTRLDLPRWGGFGLAGDGLSAPVTEPWQDHRHKQENYRDDRYD